MKFPSELVQQSDPYGGFLLWISHWRPNPDDPDPEMPGLKQMSMNYLARHQRDTPHISQTAPKRSPEKTSSAAWPA